MPQLQCNAIGSVTEWWHPWWLTDRKKYIGNTSYVDEYVGPQIFRLAIAFHEPREFGLAEDFSAFQGSRSGRRSMGA